MNKQNNKRFYGKGKMKKGLRTPSPTEVGVMKSWLMEQIYMLVLPVELLDAYIKTACSDELSSVLDKYKNYNVVRIPRNGIIPEDAERLSYDLYLTRERGVGIPVGHILAYAKGNNFLRQSDTFAISARADIGSERVEETCEIIADYFRRKLCQKHASEKREPVVPTWRYAAPITYYNVDASSGATVNIGR